MTTRTITAPDLYPPVSPFSQAVWAGDLRDASGLAGQDRGAGAMVPGNFQAEIPQAFSSIKRVLVAAGPGFGHP